MSESEHIGPEKIPLKGEEGDLREDLPVGMPSDAGPGDATGPGNASVPQNEIGAAAPKDAEPVQSPTGLLVIDKPLHKTSSAMCTLVRTRLRRGGAPKRVKVGHGGTLDPLATGVVVILVGKATRECERVMVGEKVYVAEVDLGHTSPTHDLEATPEPIGVIEPPTPEEVARVCASFVGVIQQVPPAHSAMKVGGRRAYQLARHGQDPKLEARPVRIDAIEILSYAYPLLKIEVRCGKGTYIRSLARDLGRALRAGGMLVGLRRTRVGEFSIDQGVRPEDLAEAMTQDDLMPLVKVDQSDA